MYKSYITPFLRQFSKNIVKLPSHSANNVKCFPSRTFYTLKSCCCENSTNIFVSRTGVILSKPFKDKFSTSSISGIRNYSQNYLFKKPSSVSNVNINSSRQNINFAQQSCGFRTSATQNAIPPAIVLLASRMAKFGAALLGRRIRTWWRNLPPEKRAIYVQRLRKYRNVFGGTLGAFFFCIFVYHETHLQEAPFTKRKRFIAFSPDQFDQLAKEEFNTMLGIYRQQIIPANPRNPVYRRVSKVCQRLLDANKDIPLIRTKEWTITVVDDANIQNAFVLPCGNIFVFSGMLDLCDNDDELGVVLGHEMAHAVLGHGAENASNMHLFDLLMVVPLAMLWAVLPTDLSAAFFTWLTDTIKSLVVSLPYARLLEIEADEVGLILAAKACFDVRHGVIFWDKMTIVSDQTGLPQLEWLSTHPNHEQRKENIEAHLPEALEVRQECQCGRLPNLDMEGRVTAFKKKLVSSAESYDNLAIRLRVV